MTSSIDRDVVERAATLADELLFPNAVAADRDGDVPTKQLDALAAAGMYGASITCTPATIALVIEKLASGCLTTAFIWAQHLGATAAAWHTSLPANRFAADLEAGRLRGGVAFAHMLRPDPPITTAEPVDGGWSITGSAPWVTGWGHIDLVHAAARHGDDIVWALIDAVDSDTLHSDVLDLAVVQSTRTAELTWTDHFVPEDRVTRVVNHQAWLADYRLGLRNNGSFPLGVAARCCALLGRPEFTARLDDIRSALDSAGHDELPALRADAALFAVTSSTALVAKVGGRGVTLSEHAQRLHREAMFLLVQGQTPQIKALMLDRLTP